ncbi:bifunctional arginine demethylase and lysyl-hydroxylase JMJD6 isoform X3 [Eurytemora carolleeae]|uniref:bifunctional arginine demethylase and lysyl-hydroxylase JMJD6 isoform X3 n=1 Tax=Eurytemora carolleeae TaxID=1294199 RepID=UPI000C78C41D|nr:bifunctional arginine demethylase and lysyl-hydroxylase JMJD6 isoform X3 [Eurytemora carolleeae]|eukprot:XP_023323479.1 bifunctional arginine demethylase and lysyl-hydroxylase JMJD6-like isoform X3 [Eurytemora affinis]
MDSIEQISCWPPPQSTLDHVTADLEESGEDNEADCIPTLTYKESKRAKLDFDEPVARVAFATWLRRQNACNSGVVASNLNPSSRLYQATSTKEGVKFLNQKLRVLEKQEPKYEDNCEFYRVLATYCDLLNLTDTAIDYCLRSLKLSNIQPDLIISAKSKGWSEEQQEAVWLYFKLRAEKQMLLQSKPSDFKNVDQLNKNDEVLKEGDKEHKEDDGDSKNGDEEFKNGDVELKHGGKDAIKLSVQRIPAADLSIEDFRVNYVAKRRGVIITGCPPPTSQPWTHDYIRSQAGESKVTVKSSCPESTEWANLQDVKVQTVHDFLDQTSSQNYLFDWSLPLNAPKLAADFKIPQYFSHNLLMKTPLGSLYRDSWPSLFIGPRGTKSGLHIVAFGSHFWMYLVSGVKKWTFYPPERAGDLNPVFFDSMDPVFNPSIDSFHNIQHYSVDLRAGELLFVPAGSPHQVQNTEDTVAVSGNFVDETNLNEFIGHLKINGLLDPRSRDLLQDLDNLNLVS